MAILIALFMSNFSKTTNQSFRKALLVLTISCLLKGTPEILAPLDCSTTSCLVTTD